MKKYLKKYLKLQAKKSLSLFLAVLMLMSCWVWVAPTEANADQHTGQYYIEVYGNLPDWTTQSDVTNAWTAYNTDNSKSKALTCLNVINTQAYSNTAMAYGWVDFFPSYVKNTNNVPKVSGSCGTTKNGDSFRYENLGVRIRVYNADGTYGWKWLREQSTVSNYTVETSFEHTIDWDETSADFKPYAASVRSSVATQKLSITVPSFGATTNGSVAFTAPGVYDQYGTKIGSVTGYNLYSDNAAATTAYTKEENGVWVSGTTVYASPDAQKGIPNASGSQKVYLFGEYNELKGLVAEVTLNYLSYTVKVDPDGSISGLGSRMDMSDKTTQTGAWTTSGPYSSIAAKYPSGTATKTGYTFKGFWTVKQPTTGDAGINADEATFAEPVDTATFDTYKAQEGAKVDGSYVTLADGKKYFNAGTQWDGAIHKEILGNNTFYGWWIPQDITVKFYDVDGKYLGTKTAKYGSKQAADWYLNPKDGYNAGAYEYKGFAGKWRDITGIEVVEGSYVFGELATLTLTPIYTTNTYKDKYQINFIDPTNGGNLTAYSKEYTYRDILEGAEIPTGIAVPNTLANAPGYTYEFTGWTSLKPASGNYHTLAVGDTTLTENTDWVVREDITYYAVFRSTVKEYLVAFNYIDSTGANKTEILTVPYGSAISTPSVVNRTYATGGYGYTLAGWTYKNGSNASATLDADATLVFDNTKVFVTTNNLAPNGTAIVFTAAYGEGQPTPYTVTFKYKDATGKDKVITGEVYHGNNITQALVDELAIVPETYDDGAALYTFSNLWKVTEGTAAKAEYTKDEFTSFAPTSHVTFEALYGEGVPFYTVTYIDGNAKYSERVLAGSNIPAWVVDGEEYVPAKADTETGEYTFAGWFDAAQTDKDFATTNGKEYTLSDTVNADITLYSQFIFSPFTFTVKFVNYDGTVLAEDKFEAGESFEEIYEDAEEKASKPADATYSYAFIGWDKALGNYICEGKDITFTAQYRPEYITYYAKWYNDKKSMEDADSELEILGDDGFLAKTSHTYKGKVYAPSVALTAPAGMVFDSWKYIDKNGNEATYVRGMAITDGMSFYATYKDAPVTYTLTAIIGDETYTYELAAGSTAEVAGTPVDGYVDEDSHNEFLGWFTADNKEFDLATVITADITITAKFEVSGHDKSLKELVTVPTYYAKGSEKIWCACSREDTEETVELDMLTDTVAPTGTIYIGDKSWSSTDSIGAAATDGDPVTIYANADTDIILTLNDTGDVTAYNTSGAGKGIALIQGIISTGVFGADTTEIAGIQTIFSDSTETLNNTANYVIRLGTYAGLVDGETYIAYYYAKDKAGNVLNKNVRTAKFIYDNTAPEITIAGDNNGAKVPTYCGKAVVKGIENGSTVLVNGEAVTLTTSGAAGTSHYEIKEAGNYVIKVTDKAGNVATTKIVVADGHDEIATSKAVSCTEDGYEKIICAICNKIIKEETITSEGHKYGAADVIAATCTEDGYTVETCTVCGYENKTNVTPMLNHVDTGRYTKVTKAATCSVVGEKTTYCQACDAVMGTEEIPVDKENGHNYGSAKVLKPTCTEEGKKYQQCKICYEQKTIETIPALNHEGAGTYTAITTEATCYSKGVETTYCKVCDEALSTKDIDEIAHTLKLVEYNTYKQYECQVVGCKHTEGRVDINVTVETYTVTFKGAGENGADLTFKKKAGETIAKNVVADQTKADDNEHTYKFAGWKGTDDKVVKLPVKVTKDETYEAAFTASTRTYTHKFVVIGDDGKDTEIATLVGKYNDTDKKTSVIPTKSSDGMYDYTFAGWIKRDGESADQDPFTMTEDATFVATFTEKPIEYKVLYLYDAKLLAVYNVPAGGNIPSYDGPTDVLVKDYDNEYHYTFKEWTTDTTDKTVLSDIIFQAAFKATEHNYTSRVTEEPTCVTTGVEIFECTDCDRQYTKSIEATGHNLVDGICTVCGTEESQPQVSIIFKGDNGTIYSTSVAPGATITYNVIPTKDSDLQNHYTFIGWREDGNEDNPLVTDTVFEVNSDITYVAVFRATSVEYTVTYYNGGMPIQNATSSYNAYIPAYEGETPEKAYTDNEHYEFIGWSVNNGPTCSLEEVVSKKVTGNVSIYAKFKTVRHELGDIVPGTCAEATHQICKGCGYKYYIPGETTKEHTPDPATVVINDSTFDATGTKTYDCTSCDKKITETIPVKSYYFINIMVWNDDGSEAQYANVKLKYNGEFYNYYADGKETVDGFVSFKVDKSLDKKLWSAHIVGDGIEGGISGAVKTATNTDTNINEFNKPEADVETPDVPQPEEPEEPECSCSCHKNTFWGMIFRFFQKIVRLFGGKDCCADARK